MSQVSKIDYEKIFSRLFIALLATFLAFLSVEYISRQLLRFPEDFGKYTHDFSRAPSPYVMFTTAVQPTVPSTKDPDEVRIFLLGASTVVQGNPPIPTLLQHAFEEHGCTAIKVYHFGSGAEVSSQTLARIVFHVVDLAPDIIVVYNGDTDISMPFRYDARPGYPYNFLMHEGNPILRTNVRRYPTFALLLYGSNLLRHLFPEYFTRQFVPLERVREEAGYGSEGWRNHIANIYVNNVIKAHKIANTFGAEFIVFFQPALAYKDVISSAEEGNLGDRQRQHSLIMRDKILSSIEIAKRDTDLQFVDVSDIYDNVTGHVFMDNIHTRQEMKNVISRAMYKYLVDNFGLCESPDPSLVSSGTMRMRGAN